VGVAEGTHWVLKRTVFLWLEKLSTKLEHVFTSAFPPSDDLGDEEVCCEGLAAGPAARFAAQAVGCLPGSLSMG
jgi:hypothetical protein